ncbi:ATP-binding protein [Nonomuraea sp. SMC257]|uniref:ATP-binding protein n=1 Tax=Nonomuraea montanisoli TaxID=2741721 RepID=A0A7Y6M7K9_9ACTN|nr:ATP-binding protein [Nonomuraea montanisoli]NUW37577.1 ATP-binding protein [Nonomuraea montanisoli]
MGETMKVPSVEQRVIGSIQLVGIRESVSHARSEVRRWLGDDHPAVDDAVLAASELLTNALRHSDARPYDFVGLTVTGTDELVYVEVRDPGSAFSGPHVRREPQAEDGRGLLIVSKISQDWGVREHGRVLGRTVWCAIRAASPSPDLSTLEPVSGSAGGLGPG